MLPQITVTSLHPIMYSVWNYRTKTSVEKI